MKLLIFTIVSISASLAFACPELNGAYTCSYADGSTETMMVSKSVQNGVVVYTVDEETFYADGNAHAINEEGLVGQYTATCSGNIIQINLAGDFYDQGAKIGDMSGDMTVTANGNGFDHVMKGMFNFAGQQMPIDEKGSCVKN